MNIQPTSEKCLEYLWFGKQCLDLNSTGNKAIQDGLYTIICKYTPEKAVLIVVGGGNFLTHPRTGKLRLQPYFDNQMNQYYLTGIDGGGWREDLSELANRYTYPLQDDDKGTWVVNVDDTTVEWLAEENYGNCYWWDGEVNGEVLSWKGPPNGLSISGMYNIPGLSQVENTVGTTPYYTTFGVFIYQSGEYLCHGPQWFIDAETSTLVAGAMYINGTLCCLTVTNKQPGFFLQLWTTTDTGKTWTLIKEVSTSGRLRVPAQISKDGKTFVYDGSRYLINDKIDGFSLLETMPAASKGSRVVVGTGGQDESSYKYTGSLNLWSGMAVDEALKYSKIDVDAKFEKTTQGTGGYQKSTQPVYRGNPATVVTVTQDHTAGTEIWFSWASNGSYCSVDWSGVDRVENGYGVKTVNPTVCNSDFTVTATANPQGVSGSFTYTASGVGITLSRSGDNFAASGGLAPYTYATTKGTIDPSTGIANFSGQCGVAFVTASDSCGATSAPLAVRMATGVWVRTFDYTCVASCTPFVFAAGVCSWTYNCKSCDPCPITGSCSGSYIENNEVWVEAEDKKTYKSGFHSNGGFTNNSAPGACCLGSPDSVAGAQSVYCLGANNLNVYYTGPSTVINRHIIEEWWCSVGTKGW